jgi:hypothetical protein
VGLTPIKHQRLKTLTAAMFGNSFTVLRREKKICQLLPISFSWKKICKILLLDEKVSGKTWLRLLLAYG